MGFLLKIAAMPGGLWILLGIALAIFGAGTGAGYVTRGVLDAPIISHQETLTAQADARTEQCKATHEKGRADGAEKVIGALADAATNVIDATGRLTTKANARAAADQKFLMEIKNAPASKVCGGSAAERAYRDSVREQAAPAAP